MSANPQNLKIPTSEEARRNGAKGGMKSVESRRRKKLLRECLEESLESAFSMAGMRVEFDGNYPAWQPNPQSEIVKLMEGVYRELFGVDNKVQVVHAGLECGVIGALYPEMDMVSFGPTLRYVHTPEERLHIPTVQKVWDHLLEILRNV